MKNRLMQLAAGLALIAVLGKFYAVPLIAQVRAAVVKNIDERGRVPYMVQAACNGQGLSFQCRATFPAVPPNKRLVVEYINGSLTADAGLGLSRAFLVVPSAGVQGLFLTTHFESSNGIVADYSINLPVVLYYEAGQMPIAIANEGSSNVQISGTFTLSGYLVDLTQ